MRNMIVSITGNTASGTTTLARRLNELESWPVVYSEEHLNDSPFFQDFINYPSRWAFHNQAYFFGEYITSYQAVTQLPNPQNIICLDYWISELLVYTCAMRVMNFINEEEYKTLYKLFQILEATYTPPDILVHLSADLDVLMQRILARRRPSEMAMSKDYVMALQSSFDNHVALWAKSPVIIVNSQFTDLRTDDSAVRKIAENIKAKIL